MIGRQQSTTPTNQSLLSRLPERLFKSLFSRATTVQLKTDEVLFLVGDTSDGCYRVDDGLEQVPSGLNRGDSPGAIYEGFYRH